jgi:two-component system sensor histidine kinase ChiS
MFSRRIPNISIRYVIPMLFVVLITVTVSLIGWLAFRSGKRAVDDLANQLSQETAARIGEHVMGHISMPYMFHQINLSAIRTGNLDVDDFSELETYFWEQAQLTESVPFVYLGTEAGEFVGIQREDDGTMVLWILEESTAPMMDIYRLDDERQPAELIDSVEFDPRVRPWYRAAVERGEPTWSVIYPDIARPILIITSVAPVYDEVGDLLGVLGIEFSLEQLSDFLRGLEIGQTGHAFIVERSGEIVASSAAEAPFFSTDEGEQRLFANDSSEPQIRSAAQQSLVQFGSLARIDESRHFTCSLDGVRHFVQVAPLRDGHGLDWLIFVVIPETDFIGPIYDSVRTTVLLGVLILCVALLVGVVMAQYIMQPVLAVTDAARAVEAEEFTPGSLDAIARRTDELGHLTRVFQQMAREVQAREYKLREQLQQLRIEVNEVKRRQQVDSVVETEFFRDLRAKARDMRRKHRGEKGESE